MRPVSLRLVLTDSVVFLLLSLVALSPLHDPYGGWRWALAGGAGTALGLGVAHFAGRMRLGPWLTALTVVVVYLALGPALAVPQIAAGGVAPTPGALRALLTGVIHAWSDSLTMVTPLGSLGTVLVVPFILGLLAGVIGGTLLWRSRHPGSAALIPVALFLMSAAFGSRVAELPLARGLALAAGLLVWLRWRSAPSTKVAWGRRLALTAVVVVSAGAVATGVSVATAGPSRDVLRDHVQPPFDPLDYPSPLSRFRAYIDDNGLATKQLFTTTGLHTGDRIRLATMDTFDGVVWNVAGGPTAPTQSGSFGRFVGEESTGSREVSITIGNYSGPWVPTVGETTQAAAIREGGDDPATTASLLYNGATGTMAQLGGVVPGTTYRFQVQMPNDAAGAAELAANGSLSSTPPQTIDALTKRVQQWTTADGSPSGGALAQSLAEHFREGFFSDGKPGQAPSAAGHGVKRITDLVTPDQMVGDAEQYASAMGLAAQSRGLPARVVMGFVVHDVDPNGVATVVGNDVDAWVEVNLDQVGWVAFSPTPDKDRTPQRQQTKDDLKPQASVVQPPVVPQEPNDDEGRAPQGAGQKTPHAGLGELMGTIARYVAAAGAVVVVTSPVWGLLLVKRTRRRRRRSDPDPVVRVSGGWRELSDQARDLGTRLPQSSTRYESSLALSQRFPDSEVTTLALVADRHVFGPHQPSEPEVAEYWADVDTALKRLRRSVPWWRRPIAALSPASLPWRAWVRRVNRSARGRLHSVWMSRPARASVGRLGALRPSRRRGQVRDDH